MTTSNYMPDVQVEIAFNAGAKTAATSRTWTDVSTYVELDEKITIARGRGDEFSTVNPSTLDLVFDNTDGRFSPGYASGAYYPNVLLGRPIRVKATRSSVTYTIFTGYVDSWETVWDGTHEHPTCKVQASSRLALLGNGTDRTNIIEEEYLLDAADYIWTLGDPSGSASAAETSGNNGPALTMVGDGKDVVFGSASGSGSDGLTAAQFHGGKHLKALSRLVPSGTTAVTLSFFIRTHHVSQTLVKLIDQTGATPSLKVGIASDGGIDVEEIGTSYATGGTVVNDAAVHHVAVLVASGYATLYVDGAAATTLSTSGFPTTLSVGNGYKGTGAQIGWWNSEKTAARIAVWAGAGLNGFNTDTAGARLARYAELAGIPTAEQSLAAGDVANISHIDTTGKGVLSLMRLVEATEGGVLFDAADGTLTFQARSDRYNKAVALTLDAANQEVESNLSPRLDRLSVKNSIDAKLATSSVSATARDATSIEANGDLNESITLYTDAAGEAQDRANWLVFRYATPASRVPTLAFDLLALPSASIPGALSLEISDRINVTNMPSQAEASTLDVFAEGFTHEISTESWFVTCNVTPATPYQVLVLDDATYGALDTYPLAY